MDKKQKKVMKAAEDALLSIMSDEELCGHLPSKIQKKIDKWYQLHLGAQQ